MKNSLGKVAFSMLLEDAIEEYFYYCQAKGFTKKTIIKQIKEFLIVKGGITELESVSVHDLKAYIRLKQQSGLKPQSVVSM